MASPQDVKRYVAHWMQLGKPVLSHNGDRVHLPQPVFTGDRYSPAFEQCWQLITAPESGDCYLKGTEQTIAMLLSESWELQPCARCILLIPLAIASYGEPICPCFDLCNWPNLDMPLPRDPVSTDVYLQKLHHRLQHWQPTIATNLRRQPLSVTPCAAMTVEHAANQAEAG